MDKNELKVGTYVELEHYGEERDMKGAAKIAMDHLKEDPKYYSKLYQCGLIDEPKALELAKKYFGDNKQYYMESNKSDEERLKELEKEIELIRRGKKQGRVIPLDQERKRLARKIKTGTSSYVKRHGPNKGKPIRQESLLHTLVKELLSEYEWGQDAEWWKGQLAAEAKDHLEEPAIVFDKRNKHYYLASVDVKSKKVMEIHPLTKSKTAEGICKLKWVKMYKQIHEVINEDNWRVDDYKWIDNPVHSCKYTYLKR